MRMKKSDMNKYFVNFLNIRCLLLR